MKTALFFFVIFTLHLQAQFTLQTKRSGTAKQFGAKNHFTASVLKSTGKTAYTIEQDLPFDVPYPTAHLNEETGMLVLAFPFDGFVNVYNAHGKKIWDQNFFKEMGPNYERTITVALGTTSVAFLTSDVTLPRAMVHFFSLNGKEKWKYELPYTMGYEIAMTQDETLLAAGSYFSENGETKNVSLILSNEKQVLGTTDILFRKAAFSPLNDKVVFMSEREAKIISTRTGNILANIKKESTETIFTDVLWNDDECILQEAHVEVPKEGKFYYTNPIFTKYSDSGKELSVETMVNTNYSTSQLRRSENGLQFVYDGKMKVLFTEE